MKSVVILAGAEANLLELFSRCEDQTEGKGVAFHDACAQAFHLLARYPFMAPIYSHPFRRYLLRRWHVGLFFTVEGDRLLIHSAFDLRQAPDTIRRFLGLQ